MNISALLKYVSRKLHTFVHFYNAKKQHLHTICERLDFTDPLPAELESYILSKSSERFPMIFSSSQSVTYATVPVSDGLFLIGPFLFPNDSRSLYHLPEQTFDTEWMSGLYRCPSSLLFEQLALIQNLFSEQPLSQEEIVSHNYMKDSTLFEIQTAFTDTLFQNQEIEKRHNPYSQELRERNSIRNGDIEQLKKSWSEDYIGEIGILAKTPLRHYKNLSIVLVTLASRTAIDAGILPEIAFSLSDIYIQKIEDAATPEAAHQLGLQAEYQFTLLVSELKKKPSNDTLEDSRMQRCKDYIFAHLHGKLSISDIAEELFINKNYLCDLFKKKEGITIGEYILQQKIRLVQNMLIYSHYSYSEIAAYLGFSSQSHLGARFKKVTGMTLGEYRNAYAKY